MPKLDLDAIPQANTTGYPAPYNQAVAGRWVRRLRPVAATVRPDAKAFNRSAVRSLGVKT